MIIGSKDKFFYLRLTKYYIKVGSCGSPDNDYSNSIVLVSYSDLGSLREVYVGKVSSGSVVGGINISSLKQVNVTVLI